jgi:hypothetical protein
MPISKTSPNNFSSLNIQDLVDTFDLKRLESTEIIGLIEPEKVQLDQLLNLTKKSQDRIDYWNEQELVIKYLAKILEIVDFGNEFYGEFAERVIGSKVDEYELGGYVDLLIARGRYEPREPYFFIQEFKKAKNPSGDPLAQLLGELLVAQTINGEKVVYGSYIVGRFWYFVTLDGRNYTEELPLDSINLEDLTKIIAKLNWIKEYVEKKLNRANN